MMAAHAFEPFFECRQRPVSPLQGTKIARSMSNTFWRHHALWPISLWLLAFGLVEALGLDRPIAHALYYSSAEHRWIGSSGAADALAHDFIHDGGRWLARALGAGALLAWLLTVVWPRARPWRRTAGFLFLAIALSVGTVGLLKILTNVDCPWDLAEFGGKNPYVSLFGDRPDDLRRAACFPGAHASSGFALVCFYFAWRGRARRRAWWALFAACFIGV